MHPTTDAEGDITQDREYTVTVRRAVFIPELDAVREFIDELREELKADRAAAEEFQADPGAFLGTRGMNADLQNEWLAEMGVPGSEFNCVIFSCLATDSCIGTTFELPEFLQDIFG